MPIAKGPRPVQPYTGSFRPLIDLLAETQADTLLLMFAAIEQITGVPLSISAQVASDYWRNKRLRHVREWQAMGWKAQFDRKRKRVTWRRLAVGGAVTP